MKKAATRFDRIVLSAIVLLLAFGVLARVSVDEKKTSATKATTTTTKKSTTSSTTTTTGPTTTTINPKTAPFSTVAFIVRAQDQQTAEKCALLAESQTALETGMAGRSDLSGYDAMIFRFAQDSTNAFWGRGVVIPLSIAWFDANGNYVDQNSITPCDASATNCRQVGSAGKAFRYALEVPKGGFGGLKIREGANITFGAACSR